MRNGINAAGLSEMAHELRTHPDSGQAHYGVQVQWLSGTRAQVHTLPMVLGDQTLARDFHWTVDEPRQIGGSNHAPSPQEYLLSGFGACMMVAFLVGATVMQVQLERLEIEVRAHLDLRGFLDVGGEVPLQHIHYVVRVAGDATSEQWEHLRASAQAHSPNAMSLARGVPVDGRVEVLG